jgi:hypothetical protein
MFCCYIFFLLNCGQVIGPQNKKSISGKVINQDGDPVNGALINLTYYFRMAQNQAQAKGNENEVAAIIIIFEVPERQKIKIWITRHHETDTTRLLVDDIVDPGQHQVVWDGRNSANQLEISDIYNVHIAYPGEIITKIVILNNDYAVYTVMDNLACYSKTGQDGRFTIPRSKLMQQKVDFELIWTDEYGNPVNIELLPYLKIWSLHHLYGNTFADSVFVTPIKNTEVLLQY